MATDAKETKRETHLDVTISDGPERRRQGKFQPFRRLFGKKKKREGNSERGFAEAELKPSHSVGDVCNGVVSADEEASQHLRETNPLGSRALSHDSIFIPEDSAEKPNAEQSMSQENVSDKVRSLQRQIAHNIKFGQKPPSVRKSEGDEGSSDEEEVPRSPLRVMAQVESEPVDVEPQTAAHATPLKSPRSKRVLPPEGTIESINLDAVPQSGPRLDNAAAKHKLSVKPKNQRVSRKHRRITQELQEVDLQGILQEESDAQKTVEESGGVPDHSKKQRLQEDERDQPELRRKREMEQEEERLREEERKRAEELRLAEERRLWLEEERRQKEKEEEERRRIEEEERRRQEEEERLRRELEEKRRKEEEEFRLREEQERKMREEEEQKRREEERKREEEEIRRLVAERLQLEAERQRLEEEERIREAEEAARKEQEEAEKRRLQELEVKRRREEEEEQERLREEERRQQEELEEEMKRLAEEDARRMEEEEKKRQQEDREKASEGAESEWKRKAEEMRWKGMEERQPFTFKVSSGEKQILFQKVNLTPVTPGTGQQASASSGTGEGAKASSAAGAESPTRSSVYVPHTAILVTGAQLCGTAVNLDHIKDTACKSLLGLAEDKKAMGAPPTKTKTSPDRKSEKTKSLNLSSSPSDQSSAAVLAEWASIRSKIFKGVEEGKYEEYQEPTQSWKENQNRPSSEDLNESPFPHANLRKTLSASAKFSITPARKKFGDSNRNSEILCQDEGNDKRAESVSPEPVLGPSALAASSSSSKAQTRAVKSVRISDSSEECMFAKDLPSFLVPSPSQGSPVPQMPSPEVLSQTDSDISSVDARDETEQSDMGGDERPSPFGIKLRRTNYSLRFHNEQSTEKRKKRYSAGDSFDGVPGPLTPMDPGVVSPVFSDRASPTSPLRENVGFKPATSPSVDPQIKPSRSPVPSVRSEMERFISKPPVYQKPPTAPKPSDGATPPHSPLPKLGRTGPFSGDAQEHRKGSAQLLSDDERGSVKDDESSTSSLSSRASPGEEETKEKKSFFPSISIPWREKTDRKTELIRKEKPSLQSRHSLDSSKVQEKDKETGPLWITLALQKQKGFREQQQSREDRKNQREAKLAEKQGVISSSEGKGNGNSTPPKPQTPEEGKRPDSLLGRFERRENLKKANTLPSSVTVEITDSTPSPPAVKEVSKRFPPGDSQQVSTEPAWLALAKRKAKAWSDCPQIIK